jgi:hypothetical protein
MFEKEVWADGMPDGGTDGLAPIVTKSGESIFLYCHFLENIA